MNFYMKWLSAIMVSSSYHYLTILSILHQTDFKQFYILQYILYEVAKCHYGFINLSLFNHFINFISN